MGAISSTACASSESQCPVRSKNSSAIPSAQVDKCPVRASGSKSSPPSSSESVPYKNPNVYNVYSQKIDPKNQMPATANQTPAPNQSIPLSTGRVASNIPKAGTDDETWVYPSPQMFWNAMVRKNKTEGASEDDMETVIAVHNNMNENTWKQVLCWEMLHPAKRPDDEPKLLRFMGRPDELSPKARIKSLLGHPPPFDRHDWIVDRGGKEVRYVIDYYHDESSVSKDERPQHLHDVTSMKSILLDVRPALDSWEALRDRVLLMPAMMARGLTEYRPPPFFPEKPMLDAEQIERSRLSKHWEEIQDTCYQHTERLTTCSTDEECGAASVRLQACMARVVCPTIEKEFQVAVDASPRSNDNVEKAFLKMTKCLQEFELDSRRKL